MYKFLKRNKSNKLLTAIDIGSGTGWFANYLVSERKYTMVYAIEPSESAIDIAKKIKLKA